MLNAVLAILQLIFLILKNKFESDDRKRKKKDALFKKAIEAFKSGNIYRLNVLIDRLRQ